MDILKTYYGHPSYTMENEKASVFISVQGGHLTALFDAGSKKINPFFIAPWWEEAPLKDTDAVLKVLRGDFFCFPFGGNEKPYQGKSYPAHGQTANDNWNLIGLKKTAKRWELTLSMDLNYNEGRVEKSIALADGEPVIYNRHVIRGFSGKMPLGHHPTLKLPDKIGSGIIDFSEPLLGHTAPIRFENPEMGGYSQLFLDCVIEERSAVHCIDGSVVDLTHYPLPRGYEDLVMFASDKKRTLSLLRFRYRKKGISIFNSKIQRYCQKPFSGCLMAEDIILHGAAGCTLFSGLKKSPPFFIMGLRPVLGKTSSRKEDTKRAVR
jgi:hypothetical protein